MYVSCFLFNATPFWVLVIVNPDSESHEHNTSCSGCVPGVILQFRFTFSPTDNTCDNLLVEGWSLFRITIGESSSRVK